MQYSRREGLKRNQTLAKAFKKKNPYCERCMGTSFLHAHHVKPLWCGGDDVEENLMTLCVYCHEEIHQTFGHESWGEDDLDRWLWSAPSRWWHPLERAHRRAGLLPPDRRIFESEFVRLKIDRRLWLEVRHLGDYVPPVDGLFRYATFFNAPGQAPIANAREELARLLDAPELLEPLAA